MTQPRIRFVKSHTRVYFVLMGEREFGSVAHQRTRSRGLGAFKWFGYLPGNHESLTIRGFATRMEAAQHLAMTVLDREKPKSATEPETWNRWFVDGGDISYHGVSGRLEIHFDNFGLASRICAALNKERVTVEPPAEVLP